MKFAIRYLTEYRYEQPVVDNLNALRVKPATASRQRCDEFVVRVDPEARLHRHDDYFGTEVIEFGVTGPHEALTIDVRARVVTSQAPEPPEASWSALDDPSYRDLAAEYLQQVEPMPASGIVAELMKTTRARTPLATLRVLSELIPDHFEYRQGVTYVGSSVADLIEAGAGVCQDFVHLGLMLLRGHGIAARYVSGYLYATGGAGGSDSVEVDTHAYIEALLPPAGGSGAPIWVGADPTNRGLTGEEHVKIGHGRSYADVPPVKGVYRGTVSAKLDASVKMTRLDPAESASI